MFKIALMAILGMSTQVRHGVVSMREYAIGAAMAGYSACWQRWLMRMLAVAP